MMPLGASNPPEDRVKVLEDELIRLRKELKQTTGQLSFLQVLFLLAVAVVGFGGYYYLSGAYYLAKEGQLRMDGFSPDFTKMINAKEIGLVNQDNTRVVLDSADRFGNPRITFLDPKLRLKMRVMVWPENQGGGGGITFYDDSGNGWRGQFRLAENGVSLLSMRGDKQKGGIDASVNFDGTCDFKMFDKEGKGGIAMKVDSEGTPSLVMTDKDGKTIWRTPTTSPGSKP